MTEFARSNDDPRNDAANADELDNESFRTLARKNPQQAFIVGMELRPGLGDSLIELEDTHYTPDTPANEKFELFISNWQGLAWCVAAIPLEDLPKAEAIFAKNKLVLRPGRIPFMLAGGKAEPFPLEGGDNVFTVESGTAGLSGVVIQGALEPKAKA